MIEFALFKHQQEAIAFAINNNACVALLHDCGVGKTVTALKIFEELRSKEPNLRLLVVSPKSIIHSAWIHDTEQFTNFSIGVLKDTLQGDIIIANYEYLIGRNGIAKINQLLSVGKFACIIDESQKLKNSSSIITKTMLKLRDRFKHRMILTGTFTPNSSLEMWGQISFIAPWVLPASFFQFRNAYFHLERSGQQLFTQGMHMTRQTMQDIFRKGFKYVISAANNEKLLKLIKPYCHRASKSECLDLPEQINTIKEIELSSPERAAYNTMKRHLVAELGDITIAAPIAIAKLCKLREATSGFMYTDTGEAIDIGCSKLIELENTLEELGEELQVIIFVEFCHELDMIYSLLTKK
jgi:SNF2 family DNA or RNA helicase